MREYLVVFLVAAAVTYLLTVVAREIALRTGAQADQMLGERVAVTVDDGESPVGEASTIVDCTGPQGRVLREGALTLDQLNEVLEPLGATLVAGGADA